MTALGSVPPSSRAAMTSVSTSDSSSCAFLTRMPTASSLVLSGTSYVPSSSMER